jgi:cephalosporin hydroxylase
VLTLDELAELHGTDKGLRPFRHLTAKGYTTHYERLFAARRNDPVRLLEIGVASGGSLAMWADYFPRGEIVGLDLDPICRRRVAARGIRASVVIGNQGDPAVLATAVEILGGAPDIVIDDGSHRLDDQRESFAYLFPRMPSGAVYAIEDSFAATVEWFSDRGGDDIVWVHGPLVIVERA